MRSSLFSISRRCFGNLISVEGNIASGKTSILSEVKKRVPQCMVHEEPVDKWRNLGGQNILDLMYQDTKRWGFLFQSYVQLTMFEIHQKVLDQKSAETIHVLERSIFSARYCFVENFKKNKLMSDVEIEVVDGWFRFLTEANRCPLNLIVYLRTDPECVYKRILKRARPEERVVSPDYLEQLHALHENWLLPHLRQQDGSTLPLDRRNPLISIARPLLPKCPVLVIDATLPWNQVCEQVRDVLVPTLASQRNQRAEFTMR